MTDFDFTRPDSLGATYWINDRSISSAFQTALEPPVADLVTVALSCYAVDRLSRRTADWGRDLAIRVPVADPERWTFASTALAEFLGLLTSDRWELDFVGLRPVLPSERQPTLFPESYAGSGAVGLFSGGLDSLAGTTVWLENHDGPLVLFGVRSNRRIGHIQSALAARLRERYGPRVTDLGVALELRGARSSEPSQRSRGFLFLALAAAAARTANIPQMLVFENGYGAYNPRLAEHQQDAAATRSTHPYVLSRFAELLQSLDMPVSVALPHQWQTKAEVLRLMPGHALEMIALTCSCDGFPLRLPGLTHCGRCGSCILRQQSLLAAGLREHDRADYRWRQFHRSVGAGEIARLMARQAWLFRERLGLDQWPEALLDWPSLGLGVDPSNRTDRASILRLMRAYAQEWSDLMQRQPALRDPLGWPLDGEAVSA